MHKAPTCPQPCSNCHRPGHYARLCRRPEAPNVVPVRTNPYHNQGQPPYGARRRDAFNAGNFPSGTNNVPLLLNRANTHQQPHQAPQPPHVTVIRIQSTTLNPVPVLPTTDLDVEYHGTRSRVSCQLDTASHINVITEAYVDQLRPSAERIQLTQAIDIAGCDDIRTHINEAITLFLVVRGKPEKTTFFIMQGTTPGCPILLGSPWMQDHVVQLYYIRNTNQPDVRMSHSYQPETIAIQLPTILTLTYVPGDLPCPVINQLQP